MLYKYIAACALSFILMFIVTPFLIKLAQKTGYVENPKPDIERKVHKEPKPYLASIGMFGGFWLVYFCFTRQFDSKTAVLFFASLLILAIGLVDDRFKIKGRDLKALPKAVVQLACSAAVYFAGYVIVGVNNPFNDGFLVLPGVLQFFITVMWIFGITTVINFADGLDGLSGGISCIAAMTLFIVAIVKEQPLSAMMSIILVGICLGYLKYNKFPSRILMGDAGATFLGFILAVISLDGAFKQATVISIFIPVLAFGLPIFDNLYVAFKRIRAGKSIFTGDASQVHYRLLSHGLTQRQAVYFLYLVSLCFNLGAVIVLMLNV